MYWIMKTWQRPTTDLNAFILFTKYLLLQIKYTLNLILYIWLKFYVNTRYPGFAHTNWPFFYKPNKNAFICLSINKLKLILTSWRVLPIKAASHSKWLFLWILCFNLFLPVFQIPYLSNVLFKEQSIFILNDNKGYISSRL